MSWTRECSPKAELMEVRGTHEQSPAGRLVTGRKSRAHPIRGAIPSMAEGI
jgi:hypothetical protein